MKTYELTYIVSPDITLEEAEAKGKEIESLISSKEGTILKQSNPSARTLSYQIKKRASGFFGVLEFQVEPEGLLELKETISKDSKIVRNMLIIKEAAMMRKERRTRTKSAPVFEIEKKAEVEKETEVEDVKEEKPEKKTEKEKVELKDIEQKLDELLGE